MTHDLQFAYSSMWLTMTVVSLSLVVGIGFRPSGLRTWNAALIWQAVGWGILAVGPWHEATRWLTASFGAAALAAGVVFMLRAAGHYLGRPLVRRWVFGPPLAAFALHLAAVRFESIRMALVSLLMAVQLAWLSWTLLPKRRAEWSTRWRWLASCGYFFATLVVAVPTSLYVFFPAHSLPAPNATWATVFATIIANGWATIALVCTLAFLLAHRDEAEQALLRLASRDGLTGLLNRRAFMERGEHELAVHRRNHHPIAIAIIDLDHFKRINDSLGHPTGDAVIELFAKLLMECVGAQDLVDRHGGEEFCVLLQEGLPGARHMDFQLRTRLPQHAQTALGFTFDFSVGAAVLESDMDETLAMLIERADRALYAAKHAGRGRIALDAGTGGRTCENPAQASAMRFESECKRICETRPGVERTHALVDRRKSQRQRSGRRHIQRFGSERRIPRGKVLR